jgi:glycosyltransferase involved in cell wall biosynthesis
LRIAVYENLPPGGAQRTSYEIGRELIRRGNRVDVFRLSTFPDKGPFDLAADAENVHVAQFNPLLGALGSRVREGHFAPRSYTLFRPLRTVHRQLGEEIRSGGYDAVLLHPDAMTGAPYVLAFLEGIPTVYYCQEPPRISTEQTLLDQHRGKLRRSTAIVGGVRVLEDKAILGRIASTDRENARRARVIAVNSVYSRERVWAAYGRNAVVCYLGIDAARFTPGSDRPARRREVLSFGAPMEAKGHDLIVEALGLISADSRPSFRAVLPPTADSSQLEALARTRGVPLVVEKGLSEDEIVERYRRALATVCAGRLEPFGLTAIESMACATPVVAIREGGFRESVSDGVTGILAEPDPRSIAGAIGRVAADAGLAAKMGLAGRQDVVGRWTWARTAAQMEEILQDAARN